MLDTKQLLTASVLRENGVATAMVELQRIYDKSTAKPEKIQFTLYVPVIAETRIGKCGQPLWPLWVWDLIMEQLVIGVSPKSIYCSIGSTVKRFSLHT